MNEYAVMAGAGAPPETAGAIPCFVINLPRDRARFAAVSQALAAMNIPCFRHPAVNGKKYGRWIRQIMRQPFWSADKRRALTDGEIGCVLSHVSVLRRMVRENIAKAIVLEDDAEFAKEFPAFWAGDLPRLLDAHDLIKLEGILFAHVSKTGAVLAHAAAGDLVLPMRPSLGSAGYAITLKGAKRMLRTLARVDDPMDHKLVKYERHGVRYGEMRPLLIRQADSAVVSALELERKDVDAAALKSGAEPWARLLAKLQFAQRGAARLAVWALWLCESRLRADRAAA